MSEREHASEEQVSRLLAASAATDPPPADVVARLDDVLADLVAGRSAPGEQAPGEQAPGAGQPAGPAPRRRRPWPGLLVAAAAVSVVALGIGNLDGLTGTGSDQASSADSAGAGQAERAEEGTAPDGVEGPSLLRDEDGDAAGGPAGDPEGGTAGNTEGETRTQVEGYPSLESGPRLTTSSLLPGLQQVEDFALAVPAGAAPAQWATMCVRPATSPGDEWLPVHLDGEPGVLVLRAPAAGRRTADIFTCEDADVPAVSTEVTAAR